MQLDPVFLCPEEHGLASQLCAIITDDSLWLAVLFGQLIKIPS